MKFSTSSALLLSFLLLASMMVEPVQSTEIRIRENKDKNKQHDFPLRRTLKGGSGKGGSGKGGTCSNKNADKCVSELPDSACRDNVNSHIDDTGACVGLDSGNLNVCGNMNSVTVDKYSCVDTGACSDAAFTEICESSCQGLQTCSFANSNGNADNMLTIGPGSCRSGSSACYKVQNVEKIGSGSCIFNAACTFMKSSTGDRTTVGDNSCIGARSCTNYQGTFIGDNACVGTNICQNCMVHVPEDKCNVEENTVTTCANCPCACP